MRAIHLFMSDERGKLLTERLAVSRHSVEAVYLPEDMGAKERILEALNKLDIKIIRVKNPNDESFIDELASAGPDLIIVAGFSTIFKPPFLAVAPRRIINLHAGLLPKYRGGSPLNWQLIMGEQNAGISIIRMDKGIDTGDILAHASFPISTTDTIVDLHKKANALFPNLVLKVLQNFDAGNLNAVEQPKLGAKYWHQRNFEDGQIDWASSTATEVDRFIRALVHPYPGAFSYLNGDIVRFHAAEIPELEISGRPGRVCYVSGVGPYIICKDKALLITNYEIVESHDFSLKSKKLKIPNGVYLRLMDPA